MNEKYKHSFDIKTTVMNKKDHTRLQSIGLDISNNLMVLYEVLIFSRELSNKLSFYDFNTILFGNKGNRKIFVYCNQTDEAVNKIYDTQLGFIGSDIVLSHCDAINDILIDNKLKVPFPNHEARETRFMITLDESLNMKHNLTMVIWQVRNILLLVSPLIILSCWSYKSSISYQPVFRQNTNYYCCGQLILL